MKKINELFTIDDLAILFGRKRQTIYNWLNSGKLAIKKIKIGHSVYFDSQEVFDWIERQKEKNNE